MKFSKKEIIEGIENFCEAVGATEDSSSEEIKARCGVCPMYSICSSKADYEDLTQAELEKAENVLVDCGFLGDCELKHAMADIVSEFRNWCLGKPDVNEDGQPGGSCCEKCILYNLCEYLNGAPDTIDESKYCLKILKMAEGLLTLNGRFKEECPKEDVKTDKNSNKDGTPKRYEKVNAPSHYNGTECIENMRKLYGDDAVRWFCVCNAYKYRFRAGGKPGENESTDFEKAKWYENYAVSLATKEPKYF